MKATTQGREVAFMADDSTAEPQKGSGKPLYSKICEQCGQSFTTSTSSKRYCTPACRSAHWTAAHLEEERERKRNVARQSRATHPERQRETGRRYRQNHPDRTRAAQRQWRETHPEHVRDYGQQYYAQNAGKLRGARRRWRRENPQKAREGDRRQHEKFRQQVARGERERSPNQPRKSMQINHGTNWEIVFARFWEVQGGCCYLYGDPLEKGKPQAVTMDHNHDCCPYRQSCEVCRRGLACGRCNKLVGLANEDPIRLHRIADALEAANRLVQERSQARDEQGELF